MDDFREMYKAYFDAIDLSEEDYERIRINVIEAKKKSDRRKRIALIVIGLLSFMLLVSLILYKLFDYKYNDSVFIGEANKFEIRVPIYSDFKFRNDVNNIYDIDDLEKIYDIDILYSEYFNGIVSIIPYAYEESKVVEVVMGAMSVDSSKIGSNSEIMMKVYFITVDASKEYINNRSSIVYNNRYVNKVYNKSLGIDMYYILYEDKLREIYFIYDSKLYYISLDNVDSDVLEKFINSLE